MYLKDGTNVIPSLFCKRQMEHLDLDRIRYLELCADGHVVAKVLFHLINLISVGFHD